MPPSNKNVKRPNTIALKQAANWQCRACGRECRRHDESLEDFALRSGNELDDIAAHPRRWMLHVTRLYSPRISKKKAVKQVTAKQAIVVLCGSCHRAYHNSQRWQHRQQQHRQRQEHLGQLTLSDIRLPLAGLQLSLSEWSTPYEIVNPLPTRRRMRSQKASGDS